MEEMWVLEMSEWEEKEERFREIFRASLRLLVFNFVWFVVGY